MIIILKSRRDRRADRPCCRARGIVWAEGPSEPRAVPHHHRRDRRRDEARDGPVRAIPGVADVIPVLPPYKLASSEAQSEPTVVDVAGVKIGGGNLAMIAGPCASKASSGSTRSPPAVRGGRRQPAAGRSLQAAHQPLRLSRAWAKKG